MRYQSALLAAASLATTHGFLITPEMAGVATEKTDLLKTLISGTSQGIDVQCQDCPLYVDGKEESTGFRHRVLNGVENTIHLEFSTKSGVLMINNATVFPLEKVNEKFPMIKAYQTRLDTGADTVAVPVDFALEAHAPFQPRRHHRNRFDTALQSDHELYTIDFTVIGLAGTPVKAQTAHADLVHHHGVYTLARLRGANFDPVSSGRFDLNSCSHAQNVRLCRMRVMAAENLRKAMDAARGRAGSIKEWMRTHGPGNKARPCQGMRHGRLGASMGGHHKFQPGLYGYGHQGQHGHHHHRHHRVLHYVFFILKALIVPAVLGFAIGFTVSAIGMLFGRLVVFLWSRFYRGDRQNASPRGEIVIEDCEKEELMAEGEEPPAYAYSDEAPAYVQTEQKPTTQE